MNLDAHYMLTDGEVDLDVQEVICTLNWVLTDVLHPSYVHTAFLNSFEERLHTLLACIESVALALERLVLDPPTFAPQVSPDISSEWVDIAAETARVNKSIKTGLQTIQSEMRYGWRSHVRRLLGDLRTFDASLGWYLRLCYAIASPASYATATKSVLDFDALYEQAFEKNVHPKVRSQALGDVHDAIARYRLLRTEGLIGLIEETCPGCR
ncbi:hypothetical protein NMY22_g15104 [Coprinellus aureogranulatus]|nr:hypothetical protein NMY22_g15104 [Coprinellus aureogranulatus]